MGKKSCCQQYDDFASNYSWLYSERILSGESFLEKYNKIFKSLSQGARILDCACGIGIDAIALYCKGYKVAASDISGRMIYEAKRRAREAGAKITFKKSAWIELPHHFKNPFDAVFCCGNAIGHCVNGKEMIRSFRGIRKVLNKEGLLVLDSRNWEKIFQEKLRFNLLNVKSRDKKQCIPLYVWTYGKNMNEPIVVEVILIFKDDNNNVSYKSYSIKYYPFKFEELVRRLKVCGFEFVETDYEKTKNMYYIVAKAVL